MILLISLLLLLAINLLLFPRNTSHSLFRWVKVFVQYLVPKILLLCILLLLLGINLSFCSILKSLFVCLLIRYQIYQGFQYCCLLVAVLDPSFFFTTSPYSMLAIGPVIIAFAVRLSDSTLLSKHDGFIGCASKEAQSGSIVTLVAVTGPPRKQNKRRY